MRLRRDFGFRSVSAQLPRATCSKITFECSILYRLPSVNGRHFLRSSRCRKATGLSVQLTQHEADAAANLTELKKVNSWQQGPFVEKGGWATLPGSDPA